MWRLPEALLRKADHLTPDEEGAILQHPQLGADLLRQCLDPEEAWLVEVVLQHHEREHGQGYPRGLAGNTIHPYAKIIGLLDVYAALIHPRPYRRRLLPHEAVREIVRSKNDAFAGHLIKA